MFVVTGSDFHVRRRGCRCQSKTRHLNRCHTNLKGGPRSLFDKLTQGLQNHLGGEGAEAPPFLDDALSVLGGNKGVLGLLEQAGLGDRVQSWLSTKDKNLPVSAEELKSAIGEERVGEVARKVGVPQDTVTQLLSSQLPAAIDQASPNGKLQ